MNKQAVRAPAKGDSPLRKWRLDKGLRLEDVAEKIGCSGSQLSRIESGLTRRLNRELVEEITKLTGLTYQEIAS